MFAIVDNAAWWNKYAYKTFVFRVKDKGFLPLQCQAIV